MSGRMMVFKLVKEGKLTIEQAAELLYKGELSQKNNGNQPVMKIKFIKVLLEDIKLNKVLLDTKLPALLVKLGVQTSERLWQDVQKQYPDLRKFRINFREIYALIERDEPGKIVDVISGDGGKQLQIWLE